MVDKKKIFKIIEDNREYITALGDRLFDCPELGFKEYKTGEIIKETMDGLGIKYVCQSLTGIAAVVGGKDSMAHGIEDVGGEEGYHIAVVCDIDALPSKTGEGRIHSCGHSIQTTIGLAAAKIIKESGILEGSDVKVSFIFTPAEEFIDFEYRDGLIKDGKILFRSGKQDMIAKGLFDGVDCIISAHANGSKDKMFDINSTLAGFTAKKATFTGQASHSGAAPWLGKNSLHGAVLCENAIAFMKDRFAPEAGVRINPVITEAGETVNIIPDKTVLETYVRANDIDTLTMAAEKTDLCIKHSAEALELGWEIENTIGYMPLSQSRKLNETIRENMLLICGGDMIEENVVSGASGDIGDLGYLLPTVQFGFSGIDGIFHNDSFKIADKENCYINTVKVVCGSIYDLVKNRDARPDRGDYDSRKEYYMKNWLKK